MRSPRSLPFGNDRRVQCTVAKGWRRERARIHGHRDHVSVETEPEVGPTVHRRNLPTLANGRGGGPQVEPRRGLQTGRVAPRQHLVGLQNCRSNGGVRGPEAPGAAAARALHGSRKHAGPTGVEINPVRCRVSLLVRPARPAWPLRKPPGRGWSAPSPSSVHNPWTSSPSLVVNQAGRAVFNAVHRPVLRT